MKETEKMPLLRHLFEAASEARAIMRKTMPQYKIAMPAAVAVVFLASVVGGLRAQEDAAPTPSPAASQAGLAKKAKPKPRVKRADAQAAVASDSASDAGSASVRHICLIDRTLVDQQAAVSISSNKRLSELRSGAQAQVDGERKRLEVSLQGVEGEIKTRPNDDALKQKRQKLAAQMQALSNQAGLYSRQYEATRQGVNNQLQSATIPIVQTVASSNLCSVVLSKDVVLDAGESVEITQLVIEKMNAKLQFTPFNLVDLSNR